MLSRAVHALKRTPPRRAFTLIELLVVLTIIGMLSGLLAVAVSNAMADARRVTCVNNLREIGLATQQYVLAKQKYPYAYFNDKSTGVVTRWMDLLKPYLEQSTAAYHCPADIGGVSYAANTTNTVSYGINLFKFKDDLHYFWKAVPVFNVRFPSQVILFTDCIQGKYYCGYTITPQEPFAVPIRYVDYRHKGSFNAAYCDGHVETKTETTQQDWDASQ